MGYKRGERETTIHVSAEEGVDINNQSNLILDVRNPEK